MLHDLSSPVLHDLSSHSYCILGALFLCETLVTPPVKSQPVPSPEKGGGKVSMVLILSSVGVVCIVWAVILLELDFDEIDGSICTGYKFWEFSFPWRNSVLHVTLFPSLLVCLNSTTSKPLKGGGEVFKECCFSCALKAVGHFLSTEFIPSFVAYFSALASHNQC
ncbi:hypothetical protein H5410_032184 [Solanum commersonii]|uniref:Uncharacterized protein n=1 Tax=Solanum commersonii TaxID=4109 RepID=A0A9J5YPL2_SOLCO|nr:hypothetical protein H5410_032184 [Solanum commersonii]